MWMNFGKTVKKEPEDSESSEDLEKSPTRENEIETTQTESIVQSVSTTTENSNSQPQIPRKTRKMEPSLRPPEPLSIDGNLSVNWKRFKRSFDIFMCAADLKGKNDEIKINTLLNTIGPEAVEIFDSLELTDDERKKFEDVLKAIEKFCMPKKNQIYERFLFYQRKQKDGETFDSFLIDIKRLVRTCEFKEQENDMLRDRIVMGVFDAKLQTRLLEVTDLTYTTAVEKCRASEITREQSATMNNKAVTVNEIRSAHSNGTHNRTARQKNNNNSGNGNGCSNNTNRQTNQNGKRDQQNKQSNNTNTKSSNSNLSKQNTNTTKSNYVKNCQFCGLSHRPRECPAYNNTCNICSKKHHLPSVCKNKNISAISIDNFSDSDSDFYVGSLDANVHSTESDGTVANATWIERLRIKGKNIAFKIDTGAQIDVIPLNLLRKLDQNIQMSRTNVGLKPFGGGRIEPLGMCSLVCKFNNVFSKVHFAVVDMDMTPILGLRSSIIFEIVNPPRVIDGKNFREL